MTDKKIDESWKESILKERTGVDAGPQPQDGQKEHPPTAHSEEARPASPETDFMNFISTLGMQALSALGVLPDPATGQPKGVITSQDLAQAKYLIDVIQMIAGKTKGNLTPDESTSLEEMMYQLRVNYVEKSGI